MMITLGIIGCGWVTETLHLPVLRQSDGIHLHSACDTRDGRLRLVERRFGIPRLYSDWTGLIADPNLDAVLIATPGDSHAVIAAAALEAHKHVLVEKPLALTIPDAEALAKQARTAKVVSMVGLNFRFHPLARELKTTIERGAIGRPLAVFTTLMSAHEQRLSVTMYETSPQRGGGVFHNKVVHTLDLLRFLFDCEVVSGRATARSEMHQHDSAAVEMILANGVQVVGYFSDRAIADMTCLVIGDEGKAAVNFTRPAGVALYRREFSRSRLAKVWAYIRQAPRLASAIRLATPAGRLSSYRGQWEHFLACIESGKRATPNFDDGLAVTRAVAQLIASLDTPHDDRTDASRPGLAAEAGRKIE
jgi:predicted dehydrogenase